MSASTKVVEWGCLEWSVVLQGAPGASIDGAWSITSGFVEYAFCVLECGVDVEHNHLDFCVEGCNFLEEILWWVSGRVAPVGISNSCSVEVLDFQSLVGELQADDCPEGFGLCYRVLCGLRVPSNEDFLCRGFEEFVRCVLDVLYLNYGEVCDCR